MEKKRIVIVSPAHPYRGGQALVEAHLFKTLTQLGYDCYTVTFTLLYPSIFFPGTSQYEDSKTIFFDHVDRIERVINSINPISWFKAAGYIKKLNPDLTLFVWWMPFFGPAYYTIAHFVSKWTNSKIAFLVENYISHENRWFDKLSSKLTLSLADTFICQSGYLYDCIHEIHPHTPIHQTTLSVYDCYNLKRYDKHTARDKIGLTAKNVLMFFGLIRPYKGLDKLIRAFPKILKQNPDTHLLIVGECYESIEPYKQLIHANGIADNTLLLTEYIPNEAVELYFMAADVVVLPYNSATQSGILMIAYGFRKPVVVSDVGGLKEMVVQGKTGLIIPNNNPSKIAEAVIKVLQNDEQENYAYAIEHLSESLGYRSFDDIISSILSNK